MIQYRTKLHPSSCFPLNPSPPTTVNRLFIRGAVPYYSQYVNPRIIFIGINSTTYSTIAALLAYRPAPIFESIKIFDLGQKYKARVILNDLRLVAVFNKTNTHLQCVESYLETKDSTIIIINVQHNQLENESISTWTQINAFLVKDIVSQVCIYSPNATLIICTQPNELMTYVAWHVSKLSSERVFGLGASVNTTYAHQAILNQTENIHDRVNGYFVLGNGTTNNSCATVFADHLTVDGIHCADIYSKLRREDIENKMNENEPISSKKKESKDWDILTILHNNRTVASNPCRRIPISTDLISRQKTVTKHLLSQSSIPHSKPKFQQTITIPSNPKLRSNWTEAMLLVHIIQALIHGKEFQSNIAVNIAPIHNSRNIFINHPTILSSNSSPIQNMLPFHQAENILNQNSFLLPYEKLQTKVRF